MSFVVVGAVGIGAYGAYQQRKAAEGAASAQTEAADAAIAEQRAAREAYEQLSQPFLQTGEQGALALQNFLGMPTVNPEYTALSDQLAELEARKAGLEAQREMFSGFSESGGITGKLIGRASKSLFADDGDLDAQIAGIKSKLEATPQTFAPDPSQSGFATTLEEVNPLVGFLRDQGFEQILESAAAGSRLGSGNTNLASTVVPQLQNQRFNQLFNVAGLGANVAAQQGTSALGTATNIGNLLGNIGEAQASGIINRSNAITGGLQKGLIN
jgi:hypothetical protein